MSGTLELVKERTDIVDLIGAKVSLRQAGRGFKGLCPFHDEKTPSFVVYPDSQSYHCFGCGKSGDAFTFVMDTEHLDFRDALKLLAERAGVTLEADRQRREPEKDRVKERLIELNERSAAFFSNLLWTSSTAEQARRVLESRGVDRRTAERFSLGFAPDSFDALKSHFRSRDVDEKELSAAGLLVERDDGRTWDRFRNRIMFPITNRDGRIVGFGARALGDQQPKYLNSPQTAIFDKRNLMYALDKAYDDIRSRREIVIVEGYMDAIAAHQHGFENVVATMGTALTVNQVSSLRRYVDRVYLALDSDAAGQLATLRGLDAVRESFSDDVRAVVHPGAMIRFERTIGAEIRVVVLPYGKDPDEFIRSNPEAWPQALKASTPLVEYVLTNTLSDVERTPVARARALEEHAVPILREISDPVVLSYYAGLTARLLGFRDSEVQAAIRRRPSQQTSSPVRDLPQRERQTAHDPEPYLISLMLRYPQAGMSLLHLLDREDVLEARHREILTAIVRSQGDVEAILRGLPEELSRYADELLEQTESKPGGLPSVSSREIGPAMQRLAQIRYEFRLRQVQQDLHASREAGDEAAVTENLNRMAILAQRKSLFDPQQSPYFRDLRTVP
jgi:DNA primase